MRRPAAPALAAPSDAARAERQAAAVGAEIAGDLEGLAPATSGALPDELRAAAEAHLGVDLSNAALETDSAAQARARSAGARAVTEGDHVSFAANAFQPSTTAGRSRIGHELTHVAQQRAHAQTMPQLESETEQAPRAEEKAPTTNHAGRALSASERATIAELLEREGMPQSPRVRGDRRGALFVLHDTSANMSRRQFEAIAAQSRGPLGQGVAAWVPRAGDPVVARPDFFELRRPTATRFEKHPSGASQDRTLRQIWAAASAKERTEVLDRVLRDRGLTDAEMASERRRATAQLGGADRLMTTAHWSVEQICSDLNNPFIDPKELGDAERIRQGCETLGDFFSERNRRIRGSVHVEIQQVPGPHAAGTQTKGPLPDPAYSGDQFRAVMLLYLRAALSINQFPEVTTHFLLDSGAIGGHGDPRCFDVDRLYADIAAALGHPSGSLYGITPSYGTTRGTHNVWWTTTACHRAPPR